MLYLLILLPPLFHFCLGSDKWGPDIDEVTKLRIIFKAEFGNSHDLLTSTISAQIKDIIETQKSESMPLNTECWDYDKIDELMLFQRILLQDEQDFNQVLKMFWASIEYLNELKFQYTKKFIIDNNEISLEDLEAFENYYPYLKYSCSCMNLSIMYILYFQFIRDPAIHELESKRFAVGTLKTQLDFIQSGYNKGKKTANALKETLKILRILRGMLTFKFSAEDRIIKALEQTEENKRVRKEVLADHLIQLAEIDTVIRKFR
jgi:hypothetical protein